MQQQRCCPRRIQPVWLIRQIHLWWQALQAAAGDLLPDGAAELFLGFTQQNQGFWLFNTAQVMSDRVVNIVDDTEYAYHWGRQDWFITGLVVEGDVAPETGMFSSLEPSARPWTASRNCHITSVFSGEPKFRQLVTA